MPSLVPKSPQIWQDLNDGGQNESNCVDKVRGGRQKSQADGGGISLFASGAVTIRNNVINGNSASGVSPAATGGGINMVNDSPALIVQNLIYDNTADQGAGIYFLVPSDDLGPTLVNNTIVNNNSTQLGSAIYANGFDSQVHFLNNLMIGPRGQSAVYCDDSYGGLPSVANSDAFSPGAMGFAGGCVGFETENGNISANPRFVNRVSDFMLKAGSPAIDAGTNSAPLLPRRDFDGQPRIIDGNGDGTAVVDMGAYEFQ